MTATQKTFGDLTEEDTDKLAAAVIALVETIEDCMGTKCKVAVQVDTGLRLDNKIGLGMFGNCDVMEMAGVMVTALGIIEMQIDEANAAVKN